MITIKNLPEQINSHINEIDNNTSEDILELMDMKMNEVWWLNYPSNNMWPELSIRGLDEEQLSFDDVKALYPHWFMEA